MAETLLNLGFIGLGQALERIFYQEPAVHELPYRFVAGADPRAHAVEKFCQDHPGAVGYGSAADLLGDPEVDVVYIATPAEYHLEHARLAAQNGKHLIVEKPLALELRDALEMCELVDECGVLLLAGHTHSFDRPIREISQIIREEEFGRLLSVNAWNFNGFNVMPWPTSELESTYGPVLNQGPHQVDIIRQLCGGLATSVTASILPDGLRGVPGGYNGFIRFERDIGATLVYDARGFFDTGEFYGWVEEGGQVRDPDKNSRLRQHLRGVFATHGREDGERVLESQKEQGRYGAGDSDADLLELWGLEPNKPIRHHSFFGLIVVSLEHATIRQSPDGLYIYGEDGVYERPIDRTVGGRQAELMEMHAAIVDGQPLSHDGRWGLATLEACLGMIRSAREHREVELEHQVAMRGAYS